jgi:phospho-N-acetylmuramoyl-pentapeptide-transferase
MLYSFFYSLHEQFFLFNVFRYISFRTILAILTALTLSLILGPIVIRKMRQLSINQQIRDDGPPTHLVKTGTPTMGGIFILASVILSVLLWGDLTNKYVWLMLSATFSFGAIGFYDDYLKVVKRNSKGLRGWYKLGSQIIIALIIGFALYLDPEDPYSARLSLPFFKQWVINLWMFYVPFVVVVIVGSSNAVNLTDGMDGLAIGLLAVAMLANGILVYVTGHVKFAEFLYILYIPDTSELAIYCGATFGAALGFLWYNCHPAEIFMGDVGSLGLGGALGTLAVITKQEIVLFFVGGIFVAETVSVILQVLSFKYRGKRIFKMAPLHHHFEIKGLPESKVIVRFWIIGIVLALLSLATLKIR